MNLKICAFISRCKCFSTIFYYNILRNVSVCVCMCVQYDFFTDMVSIYILFCISFKLIRKRNVWDGWRTVE